MAGWLLLAAALLLFFAEILYYFSASRCFGGGIEFLYALNDVDSWPTLVQGVLLKTYYPPLYYMHVLVPLRVLGLQYVPAVLWSSLLIIGGGLFAALSLRRLGCGEYVGPALLLYVLTPAVVIHSKTLVLENGLVFFVGLSFYLLAASRDFRDFRYSLLLGVSSGLGMLVKWTFGAYLVGPYLLALFWIFHDAESGKRKVFERRQILNALLSVAVTLLVCATWYLGPFDPVAWLRTSTNDPSFPQYSYLTNLWYNFTLLKSMLGNGWLVMLSVLVVLLSSARRAAAAILAVGVFLPVFIFSVPAHIEERYMYPLLALWPVSIWLALARTRSAMLRRTSIAAILALLVFAHADTYYGRHGKEPPSSQVRTHRDDRLCWAYSRGEIVLDDVLEDADASGKHRLPVAVHPFFRNYHIHHTYLKYVIMRSPRYAPVRLLEYDMFLYEIFSDDLHSGDVDYVVLDCGSTGDCRDQDTEPIDDVLSGMKGGFYYPHMDRTLQPFAHDLVWSDLDFIEGNFDLVKRYDFGGKYHTRLYRKKPDSVDGMR